MGSNRGTPLLSDSAFYHWEASYTDCKLYLYMYLFMRDRLGSNPDIHPSSQKGEKVAVSILATLGLTGFEPH